MAATHVLPQRRFPAEALRVALGSATIPERSADIIAVRCGLHPGEVWSDWFGAAS